MRPLALKFLPLVLLSLIAPMHLHASVFSQIQGIVHDPQHRPLSDAHITLAASHSDFSQSTDTGRDGAFVLASVPLGDYTITITHAGFETLHQSITVLSGTSPFLHFELQVGALTTTVTVTAPIQTASVDTTTSTTLVDRGDIAQTPGADRTNSLAMITDYVPGAYMTHDMLHMRGGHQVSWLIDGVEIPNTNISGNVAAQIDPKDIDYLEIQRGSYSADVGDRTYGAFNIVPRTGFERNRQAELVLTAGNFFQTNDQLSLGDHTQRFAWYASVNGNRSNYGLAPPIAQSYRGAANGFGGFASLLYNRTPKDQLRVVTLARQDYFQIPYDPDPNDFENQQFDSSGLRDGQHETDAAIVFSWIHSINATTLLQVSPLLHYNSAEYVSNPSDTPTATTAYRASTYAGAQATVTTTIARNTLQAGFYSFGQHDTNRFGTVFNDGSQTPPFSDLSSANGGIFETYISDNFKPTSWVTLTAGLRQTHFQAALSEDTLVPRIGAALRIPHVNWVFRAFYGRFYQPPPLLTASGPLVQLASQFDTSFAPLHGEHDEEHQFGVQIPYRGWLLDIDTFKTGITNFLDHSNIGNSSMYFPVTLASAKVRAWEATLRSPRVAHVAQFHLAYSNQIAEQQGNLTGGLICTPADSCSFPTYIPVDHDQRNTLNVGMNTFFPRGISASTNVYYGSGFRNGSPDPLTPYPNPYLPEHTTFDLALGKDFGEKITASVTATNVANRRVLLDNSLTFGGFHYDDPRQIYVELRYRFRF
jgi:outer membrane cobalamin receptor